MKFIFLINMWGDDPLDFYPFYPLGCPFPVVLWKEVKVKQD